MINLSSLVNLQRLTLNRGRLLDSAFQGLSSLVYIELIECDFENFKSSESFDYVPNLEKLTIIDCKNLLELNLNECSRLKAENLKLYGSFEELKSLKHESLETLSLNLSKDKSFDGKFISGLPKLKTLNLNYYSGSGNENKVVNCVNLNYDFVSSLESLFLKSFSFSSSDILYLPESCNLKILTIAHCRTECKINHADLFKRLRKLEELEIVGFISFLNGIPFNELENLTALYLRANKLTEIDPDWLSHMPNLKILDLYKNQINRVKKEMFTHLKNLTCLNLSDNELSQLDDDVFVELKNLEKLDISSNQSIRELKPQAFAGLDKLIYLNISSLNSDFRLDLDLFQALPSLKTVILGRRLNGMQSELSQKYGSNIIFNF